MRQVDLDHVRQIARFEYSYTRTPVFPADSRPTDTKKYNNSNRKQTSIDLV